LVELTGLTAYAQIYAIVKGSPYGEGQLMTAAARQGRTSKLRAAISQHRKTWVTEADFALMARHGINAVRIPVGYWVMADTTWKVRLLTDREGVVNWAQGPCPSTGQQEMQPLCHQSKTCP
jgi:aryl-phospho-beta-D-glucosidase BglC (GH1 family)